MLPLSWRTCVYTLASLSASLILLCGESFALDKCKGEARKEHNLSQGYFVTTSQVYTHSGAEFYVTCVENHSDKDLFINWFVPGPTTYVQPGRAVESPRTFPSRETKNYRGCLEYGSVADYIRAEFFGHFSDTDRIENENLGCDKANPLAVDAQSSATVVPLNVPVEAYFPSDASNPEATMLRFEASAGVAQIDKGFTSTLLYSVTPASKQELGRPEDVRIVPIFSGKSSAAFYGVFAERYGKDGIPLKQKDELSLPFYGTSYEGLALSSVRYGFIDRNDKLVAAVFVPMWVPVDR